MRTLPVVLVVLLMLSGFVRAGEASLGSLNHPEFVTTRGKWLVFVHDGGVAEVEATPEALAAAGLTQAPKEEQAQSTAFIESLRFRTQSWLQKVQSVGQNAHEAKQATALAAAQSAPAKEISSPPPVSPVAAPKKPKPFYQAADLVAEFEPDVHSGRYFQVSGFITRITEPSKGIFNIMLDDKVLVTIRYLNDKIRARDTSGNPKAVGNYKVGESTTISGYCRGLDADGRVLMGD
ncbi:MAG: hypothetical protein SFU85_05460 [Candidatus Methylacidiphilales bacterium]|nr:hypothetical protein [Candidatus Methylacidiphilales bacterium]